MGSKLLFNYTEKNHTISGITDFAVLTTSVKRVDDMKSSSD